MSRYFIDTNIFLRIIVKENKKAYSECVELLRLVEQRKIVTVTSHLVLAEIVWTLSSYYKFSRREISEVLEGIQNINNLKIIDGYKPQVALKLYANSNAKYIDCLIASIPLIHSKKWTVISYDKDFDKIGIVRLEPKQIKTQTNLGGRG